MAWCVSVCVCVGGGVHGADAGIQQANRAVKHSLQVTAHAEATRVRGTPMPNQRGACRRKIEERARLVTSPASLVSCWSPWRPTTACRQQGNGTQ